MVLQAVSSNTCAFSFLKCSLQKIVSTPPETGYINLGIASFHFLSQRTFLYCFNLLVKGKKSSNDPFWLENTQLHTLICLTLNGCDPKCFFPAFFGCNTFLFPFWFFTAARYQFIPDSYFCGALSLVTVLTVSGVAITHFGSISGYFKPHTHTHTPEM